MRSTKKNDSTHADDGGPNAGGDDAALRRYGEAFMAMFDDADADERGTSTSTKQKQKQKRKQRSVVAADEPTTKDEKRRRRRRQNDDDDDDDDGKRRRGESLTVSSKAKVNEKPSSADTKTVVFDGRRTLTLAEARRAATEREQTTTTATAAANSNPNRRMIDTKRARKMFMSAKAGKVFEDDVERVGRGKEDEPDEDEARMARFGGLNALKEEVQAFGIRGLSKWDRQTLENKRLVELGMKPKKAPRMPPTIGIGLARANEKRIEATRQEAFAAGYKLEKKVKKAASKEDRDRGVAWGASTFKNGVVRVSKREMVNQDRLVDTKALLSGGPRRGGGGGGGGGGKKKKSSKKKGAGKKSRR